MEKEIAIQLKHIDFYQREEYKKHLINLISDSDNLNEIDRHYNVLKIIDEINAKQFG